MHDIGSRQKFLASFTYIRFAIHLKTQFRTDEIETTVECFCCEFENFALSKLGWLTKFEIENSGTKVGFSI